MKLQQLRYLVEVAKQGLSISEAAEKLHTSQPGISKQIRLLEDELGIQVFIRNGKRVADITAPGREILVIAERMLMQAQNMKKIAHDFVNVEGGDLTIATTHIQARYALPKVIRQFSQRYPKVRLRIRQGNPSQIAEMVRKGEADLIIATEGMSLSNELAMLSCYSWNQRIIVPQAHPLLALKNRLTLKEIAKYPLVTYDFSFAGRNTISRAFEEAKLVPHIALTALDSDTIKTYVEMGFGVGILASMAYDPEKDTTLVAIEADHLFAASTTQIGFRKDAYFRSYMYDFIELFTPHLIPSIVKAALLSGENQE